MVNIKIARGSWNGAEAKENKDALLTLTQTTHFDPLFLASTPNGNTKKAITQRIVRSERSYLWADPDQITGLETTLGSLGCSPKHLLHASPLLSIVLQKWDQRVNTDNRLFYISPVKDADENAPPFSPFKPALTVIQITNNGEDDILERFAAAQLLMNAQKFTCICAPEILSSSPALQAAMRFLKETQTSYWGDEEEETFYQDLESLLLGVYGIGSQQTAYPLS